jgi:hypothetical protein
MDSVMPGNADGDRFMIKNDGFHFKGYMLEGKKRGKAKAHFFKEEEAALEPCQPGRLDALLMQLTHWKISL